MENLSSHDALTASKNSNPQFRRRRASRLPPGYHSVTGAAVLVGRAPSCLYDEVRRGRLRTRRWRGRMLVHDDDLVRWLTPEPAEPDALADNAVFPAAVVGGQNV
jgi:hypothetical protein